MQLSNIVAGAKDSMSDSNVNFAISLFIDEADRNAESNFIISPFSIQRLLMLILYAAEDVTNAEIQKALQLDGITEKTKENFLQMIPQEFRHVDQVYFNERLQLNALFTAVTRDFFQKSPEAINAADPVGSAQRINENIEAVLRHKIENVVEPKFIDKNISLLFTCAAYLKASWNQTFVDAMTRKASFFNLGTNEIDTSSMYGVSLVPYADLNDLDATAITLSYRDTTAKMLLILPNQRSSLKGLEKKLAKTRFWKIIMQFKNRRVAISLPKLSVAHRINLAKGLSNLGMSALFGEQANLKNAFQNSINASIPRLFHKSYLVFDEYGTETDLNENLVFGQVDCESPQKYFLANRPFLFIVHNEELIYFMGHITNVHSTSTLTSNATLSNPDDMFK